MSGDGPLAERDDSPSFSPGETRKSSEESKGVKSDMPRGVRCLSEVFKSNGVYDVLLVREWVVLCI